MNLTPTQGSRVRLVVVGLSVAVVFCTPSFGGNLDLDTTFAGDGKTVVAFNAGGGLDQDTARGVAIQADGRIVIAGFAQFSENDYDFAVARLNENGSPDSTFDTDGERTIAFDLGGDNRDLGHDVAIQADGKIVVVGEVDSGTGTTDMGVVRLNTDGSLDSTFGAAGLVTIPFDLGGDNRDVAKAVAIQSDQKIVVCGRAQVVGFDYDFALARLDTNGNLDVGFDGDGMKTLGFQIGGALGDYGEDLVIQPDGKIVVVGSVTIGTGDTDFGYARFETNGAIDAGFGPGTVAFDLGLSIEDDAVGVALQKDGKIVIVGIVNTTSATNPNNFSYGLVRLLTNGVLDNSFHNDGKLDFGANSSDTTEYAAAVATDGSSGIIAGGTYDFDPTTDQAFDFGVYSLTGRGVVTAGRSTGFDLGGNLHDYVWDLVVQEDGKIVEVGEVRRGPTDSDMGIVRYWGPWIFSDSFESGDTSSWGN